MTMLSSKQQYALSRATKRLNLFTGAVRSGKTFTLNILWLQHIFTHPYHRFLMTGVSKATLKRNVLDEVMSSIGHGNYEYNKQDGVLTFNDGNIDKQIDCIGTQDEGAEKRIQGATYGGHYGDELTRTPKSTVDMVRTRLSPPDSRLFWSANPDSPFHYVKKEYIDDCKVDSFHCHFEIDDNPSLTDEFKDELKRSYTGIFYQRMIKGLWVLAEGVIFDSFTPDLEFTIWPKDITNYYIGIDYGSGGTTVFLLLGYTKDFKGYVLKEWVHNAAKEQYQLSDTSLCRKLIDFVGNIPVSAVFPDPSALSLIKVLKEAGFYVAESDNDVINGIRTVNSSFFQKNLFISSNCSYLLEQINSSYIWDPKAQLQGIDKPLKQNDHACDALRYPHYSILSKYGLVKSQVSLPLTIPKAFNEQSETTVRKIPLCHFSINPSVNKWQVTRQLKRRMLLNR